VTPAGERVDFVPESGTKSTRNGGAGRWAVIALAAFAVAVVAIDRLAPTPGGPESSTYATQPAGLAAYADLLRGAGREVERRRRPLDDGPRAEPGTLVILDGAGLPPSETAAVERFVRQGGTLVAGGIRQPPWVEQVLGGAPTLSDAGAGDARPLAPVPETAGVGTVRTAEGAAWTEIGAALPVLGTADEPLAVVHPVGRGRALLLADASPLQNRGLGAADNAAFGLALAAPAGGTVTFLETVHGYGNATGLAALPDEAVWALGGLALAALLFAWSHARRIGPPEDDERPLPPPRADYVDALAGALARTRDPVAVAEPLRLAARDRLAARAGLGPEPGERELREAAARFGLDELEAAAVAGRPEDADGALAAARALAKLEPHHGREV